MGRLAFRLTMLAAAALCAGTASHARAPGLESPDLAISTGTASYYADRFSGKRTASGEAYDPEDFTAAHRSLPFGTRVRVTDMASGRSVVVRVNDRGPWGKGRLIDLSRAAARELGLIQRGHAQVQLDPATSGGIDDPTD
ncbi:septal ring lytic transglycosylase RlpA family protein [Sphingomonas soli]|uniref:septal ring lytic transglycosylase RlpA family protein n=1 Tax=Sphingomonas soli TaxID=266127 RepID=UPI00082F9211|nr:septal ring lytic transglycosylase RlpA family protein [Sphingomonas soli]